MSNKKVYNTWTDFGHGSLDRRLTKALTKTLGMEKPMVVQSETIPLCLQGKDVLCKATTGSGKTLAYLIPLVHRVLQEPGSLHGVILVPTKELILQVFDVLTKLLTFCFDVISAEALLPGQKFMKAELPTIIIGSPSSVVQLLKERSMKLDVLKMLVIDEADLLFSFGYEEDMRTLVQELPQQSYQAVLCSATLSTEVEELKGLVLYKPVTVDLADSRSQGQLKQFYLVCEAKEKNLFLYALIRLKLLQGKTLMFVEDLTRGYEIKLFLERFGINCSLLNSELSWKARQGVIQAFNQNVVDLCIATDEGIELGEDQEESSDEEGDAEKKNKDNEEDDDEDDPTTLDTIAEEDEDDESDFGEEMSGSEGEDDSDNEMEAQMTKDMEDDDDDKENEEDEEDDSDEDDEAFAGAKAQMEKEEKSAKKVAKAERIAKKAEEAKAEKKRLKNRRKKGKGDKHFSVTRGLDFVDVSNILNIDVPTTYRSYVHRIGRTARAEKSGTALSLITPEDLEFLQTLSEKGDINNINLKREDVDRLKYRVDDVLKSVTPKEIKIARLKELQQEAVTSAKLTAHFEDNPEDQEALQRSLREGKKKRVERTHLKTLPGYLIPEALTAKTPVEAAVAEQVGSYTGKSKKKGRIDPLTFTTASNNKKRRFTREGQNAKASREREDANVEELVPLSGRKIWKLNHRKRVKKVSRELVAGRTAKSVRKTAKKFDA